MGYFQLCSHRRRQLGKTTGLTSTAERHIAGEVIVSRLTTPESTEMHALIARMRERGVTDVAIEASRSPSAPKSMSSFPEVTFLNALSVFKKASGE